MGPFAIELGFVEAQGSETSVAIHMVNTGQVAVALVQTPGGRVRYDGEARIDGVPGTAAAIPIEFRDTEGSSCGALFPTGNATDIVDGIEVTCIDNGMPLVLMRASDFGRTGYEPPGELDADAQLKTRIESLRLQIGPLMNLGDVRERTVPKICLVAPPQAGGAISTRSFIPHKCHTSIGVLGAVSAATAAVLPGTVCDGVAVAPEGATKRLAIEHPSGEFTVELSMDEAVPTKPPVTSAALLRTARWIFDGAVHVPRSVWAGKLTEGTGK